MPARLAYPALSTHTTVSHGAFPIHPVATTAANGRDATTAVIAAPDGSERVVGVVGVDGNFALHDEARNRAVELAMAWIDQRRIASDHHVRGG